MTAAVDVRSDTFVLRSDCYWKPARLHMRKIASACACYMLSLLQQYMALLQNMTSGPAILTQLLSY